MNKGGSSLGDPLSFGGIPLSIGNTLSNVSEKSTTHSRVQMRLKRIKISVTPWGSDEAYNYV